jgi:hypothetical protein
MLSVITCSVNDVGADVIQSKLSLLSFPLSISLSSGWSLQYFQVPIQDHLLDCKVVRSLVGTVLNRYCRSFV